MGLSCSPPSPSSISGAAEHRLQIPPCRKKQEKTGGEWKGVASRLETQLLFIDQQPRNCPCDRTIRLTLSAPSTTSSRGSEPAPAHARGVRENFGRGEAGYPTPGHPMVQRGQEAGPGMMDLAEPLPSKDDGAGDGVTGVKKLGHQGKEQNTPVSCCTVARASQKYFL